MKLITVMLCVTLAGCSLVKFSPTMNCAYIKYERELDIASVIAEGCKV